VVEVVVVVVVVEVVVVVVVVVEVVVVAVVVVVVVVGRSQYHRKRGNMPCYVTTFRSMKSAFGRGRGEGSRIL
jgi:hypothetical protein